TIARLLTRERENICATGDPDQSIYGWRGANIENILTFEQDYPAAKVVRLEQNYRSTKRILAAADALIAGNTKRKEKTLWTENDEG
ncbi:MAG: UvrD-helicase domain-containing protein, partial [Phycisphaerales bacterium]